ncbi:hypothetical protein GJ496_001906 [Pomphorhynchus laevis]|nr:hypothetical protein GJ496_001906 [Pomphorhynchus laevis]
MSVCQSLLAGCIQTIEELDFKGNLCMPQKCTENYVLQFFEQVVNLQALDLTSSRLDSNCVRSILIGIQANKSPISIRLNLSKFASLKYIVRSDCRLLTENKILELDVTSCGLDQDAYEMVQFLSTTRTLHKVYIGRNFSHRTKNVRKIVTALAAMLTANQANSIRTLSLSDCKLRENTLAIIRALSCNKSLEQIDLSGNLFGDNGALCLSKVFEVNRFIEKIEIDKSGLTINGFEALATAMQHNFSLKTFQIPYYDVMIVMQKYSERTVRALRQIEQCIERNNHECVNCTERMFRLESSVLYNPYFISPTTNEESTVDSTSNTTNDAISTNQHRSDCLVNSQLPLAFSLLQQMHASIQHVRQKNQDKVNQIENLITALLSEEQNSITDDFLKRVKTLFPSTLPDSCRLEDFKKAPNIMMEDILQKHVHYQTSQLLNRIQSKINERYLSFAVQVVDRLAAILIEEKESNDNQYRAVKVKVVDAEGTLRASRALSSMPRSRPSGLNQQSTPLQDSFYERFISSPTPSASPSASPTFSLSGEITVPIVSNEDMDEGELIQSDLLNIVAYEEGKSKPCSKYSMKYAGKEYLSTDKSDVVATDNDITTITQQLPHIALDRPVRNVSRPAVNKRRRYHPSELKVKDMGCTQATNAHCKSSHNDSDFASETHQMISACEHSHDRSKYVSQSSLIRDSRLISNRQGIVRDPKLYRGRAKSAHPSTNNDDNVEATISLMSHSMYNQSLSESIDKDSNRSVINQLAANKMFRDRSNALEGDTCLKQSASEVNSGDQRVTQSESRDSRPPKYLSVKQRALLYDCPAK